MSNATDLSEEELEEIWRQVDEEFKRDGVPSDEELLKEIERLNKS